MQPVIFVGVIGSGKTTLAKALRGYRYVNFDEEWHDGVQVCDGTPKDLVARMLDIIKESKYPVVIDGWFTWAVEWWKTEHDDSLNLLEYKLQRRVKLIYLHIDPEEAFAKYMEKHREGLYESGLLSQPEWYRRTIPDRFAYLIRKVNEWATSSVTSSRRRSPPALR